MTALCCLAQLSAGCYRAEEQGLVPLEAGFKVRRLPASTSQRRRAPLRCGSRWPGFCRCYYRIGVVHSLTHNPATVHLTADTWAAAPKSKTALDNSLLYWHKQALISLLIEITKSIRKKTQKICSHQLFRGRFHLAQIPTLSHWAYL